MNRPLKFYDPEQRPWPNSPLEQTSIIGHTTPTTVRLWFRVGEPGEYWLVVSTRPIPTQGIPLLILGDRREYQLRLTTPTHTVEFFPDIVLPLSLTLETDLTGVMELMNLTPDTRYYYALFDPNRDSPWELGHDELLCFQTFPEHPKTINFGIYSCHMPYEGRQLASMEMWDQFEQELSKVNARFVLATGDQVYVDGNSDLSIWEWLRKVKSQNPTREDMITWYRDIYRGYWGIPQVQRIYRRFPTYMIWDDHEILDGWGSYTPDELAGLLDTSWQLRNKSQQLHFAEEMFEAARRVYWEYEHCHNPETDFVNKQFDYGFDCGRCGFYVLDMRGNRNYNRPHHRTLGLEQWSRFQKWMACQYESDAQALFIVSPVPVVHLSSFVINKIDLTLFGYQDDQRDHWEHHSNWDERNNLLKLVFELSQETQRPVIFISGDVHIGAAFKLSHPDFPGAKVFQVTSSGIAYAHLKALERRILEMLVKEEGDLGDRPGNIPYHFENLAICRYNNFGILRVTEKEAEGMEVCFDLFGGQRDENGWLTLFKTTINLE
ncbi:alkaline phosphatase D family protein [Laspinema olomoucense]|uniref:alkaline phosphatase D family protein n=1 Tax=Laspinema olomoucense TaxID=3231600 RepID=UPI0021BB6438|nr:MULTISPECIES: alkaline phosphatase D family protein [unclassified Laspinema]MCT7971676.1 alkaline phosphatase family protein [Laspinema sp. D3d]MCT7987913.1 alkaline phosphatase family protein [Laspinema sp. D3a]MCT7992928.1 alkaline phosphatase family protein [Laspinema sp. D3c]